MLAAIANGQRGRRGHCQQYREFYDGDQGTLVTDRLATFLSVETGQKFATNFARSSWIVWPSGWRSGFSTGDDDTRRRAVELVAACAHGHEATTDAHLCGAVMDTATSSPTGTTTSSDRFSTFTKRGTVTAASKRTGLGNPVNRRCCLPRNDGEEFDADGKLKVRMRMTMYFPDRVEKYITGTGPYAEAGWQPYALMRT